ncbi:MAG TPA: UDP-N-acetylmuramoyl-tripeptide--D-alanyl-D-alanine ligase [Chloroflexota bacterium]|nr:UDP-N-acetylmuramoyl-tripeptide--D-alanyl-D-alanine ligase [Chloroflexota bacterium]
MTLGDVILGTHADVFHTSNDRLVQGVGSASELGREVPAFTTDSREVVPGALFFALRGEREDGHNFVTQALEHGAAVAIVSRPVDGQVPTGRTLLMSPDPLHALQQLARYWRMKHELSVIGVTGSIGKTTVKEAILQALQPLGENAVLASTGNLNSEVGLPLELLRLRPDHKTAVLEMGMYQRGEIALLADIAQPQIGVVTNVQANHLERTGSLVHTAQAKAELVHALPGEGLAVLNGDDPIVWAMAPASAASTVSYGLSRRWDFAGTDVRGYGRDGFSLVVKHGSSDLTVSCPAPGAHNAVNILPAVAIAHYLGVAWTNIGEALAGFRVPGRAVFVDGPHGSTILDDRYNASAASVVAALRLLREASGNHKALLGDMYELGDEEEPEHRMVGRACADLDSLMLLGPRTRWIKEEALRAGLPNERIFTLRDKEHAVAVAREILGPNDVLLIKGSRGLHLEDVVRALTEEMPEEIQSA